MRIVCPSCSAAYDVPDSLVTPGRVVRCARCSGEWSPVHADSLVAEPAPPPPPPLPEPESPAAWSTARQSAMDRLAANPAAEPSMLWPRVAWAASILVLLLAIGGAYMWRQQIMTAWPPSERAYALFGMHQQEARK